MKAIGRTMRAALVAALLLAFVGATPALAHHKPGHDGGPGKNKSGQHQNGPQDQNGDGKPGNGPKSGDDDDEDDDDISITDGALGNNGTIKIDGEPFDTSHGNEPHVGCTLRVLYFGTDTGDDLSSTLTFVAQAPTTGDFTFTDTITLGPDEPDVAGPYDLGAMLLASGIEPHAQQGWHVKLTTNTEYSQGADVKHKVFWVKCDETDTEGAGATVLAAKVGRGSEKEDTSEAAAEVEADTAEPGPTVLGSSEDVDASGGLLPFTGANLFPFMVFGVALIAAGWSLMRLRRTN